MNVKHGVTAIIFDEQEGNRYFLLLHRVLNWRGWEFVKGGIDEGEKPEEAMMREVGEETGLKDPKLIGVLPQKFSWTSKGMRYVYTPYILRANMGEPVSLAQHIVEHDDYKWVDEKEVEALLTHADNKKIFREALSVIASRQKQ